MHRSHIAAATLAFFVAVAAAPATVLAQSATPAPAAAASAAPTAVPAPAPAPTAALVEKTPTGVRHEAFVVGDYLVSPTVYNLASSGSSGIASFDLRAGQEFKVQDFPFMVEMETNDWQYAHFTDRSGVCPAYPGCITLIGHTGQRYVPRVDERDTDIDARVGFRIAKPRIYADISVIGHESTFNIPGLNGVGLGIEKLPDFEKRLTLYFSGFYYPDLEGKFTVYNRTTGNSIIYTLSERDIRYNAGIMLAPIEDSPVFIDLGVLGDGNHAYNANPGSSTHFAGYAGLGLFAH